MAIRKLLIANRGEIAVRIANTAKRLGIATVAVYSDADAQALHVERADEAVRIGPAAVADSYLLGDVIIEAARRTGADAIHPGYGFLSENPEFVEAVEAAGLTFIGPSAKAIRAMGLKDGAKALMQEAGVPIVPGYHGEDQDADRLKARADEIGYPVLIKARAGGGGKGMRRVDAPEDFLDASASARREAENSFGDPRCLIEKYIERPRHIEIQVFGDRHGHVVHLFERDCSLQRRHQKVIEEAPAPGMPAPMRQAMGEAAVAAAKAVGYVGAGTVEFIVDGADGLRPDGFWFMEMNTRLQVEHPITEAITGLDLVELQIAVAEGKPLPFAQADLAIKGHAFEARLYAEDAAAGFLPATGNLQHLEFPQAGEGLRIDAGVRTGDRITPHYDPMIAKIIAFDTDRTKALRRLRQALEATVVVGTITNREFLARLAGDSDFAVGRVDTGLIERKQTDLCAPQAPTALDWALAALAVLVPPASAGETAALSNFRSFGSARQAVRFAADTIVEIAVESDCRGQRQVTTPLGSVTLSTVRRVDDRLRYTLDGQTQSAFVMCADGSVAVQRQGFSHSFALWVGGVDADALNSGDVLAPMPGRVLAVDVEAGEAVSQGQRLLVLEAMKMEHALSAPRDGRIAQLGAAVGDQVEQGAILVTFEAEA